MVLLELGFLTLSSTALAVSSVILVVIAARTLLPRKTAALHLPPGPRGLPLLGNLFDMPRKAAWETFADWCREYGAYPCFSINGMHNLTVISDRGRRSPQRPRPVDPPTQLGGGHNGPPRESLHHLLRSPNVPADGPVSALEFLLLPLTRR